MPAPKYTEEQRQQALEMVPEFGQAETARRLGLPRGTVTTWASRAGVKSSASEKTRAAREHYSLDNAARRAAIAKDLLAVAERLKGQIFKETLAYNFGGKDNTFTTATLPEPSCRDKQAILTSIGIALDKSLALERFDADGRDNLAAVDQWLKSVRGD